MNGSRSATVADKSTEYVHSVEGLYDERAEAVIHNLYGAPSCLLRPHHFINASLLWEPPHKTNESYYSIGIEGENWGKGYGGIRYCKHCKLINCIHVWISENTYVIRHSPYYQVEHSIAKCGICLRRIHRCSGGHAQASPRSWELIHQVSEELHRPPVQPGNYGSGWMVELPVAVSKAIDAYGEEAARDLIRQSFLTGSLSDPIMRTNATLRQD